jgi:hypothetical protein
MSVLPLSAPLGPDPIAYPGGTVLELNGDFGPAETPALRARLISAVDHADGDLYVDAHGVTGFSDEAMAAFTGARSRAKMHRTRLVVLDGPDGVLAASLRRTGRHFRFPIYPDASSAATALGAERQSGAGHSLEALGVRRQAAEAGNEANPGLANPGLANPDRYQVS